MDQALMPEHDPQEPSQLQQWTPPIIESLDFGDDYDFEASPNYPSWFDDCGSAQDAEQSSELTQAAAGKPFQVPGPETIDTTLSVARVSTIHTKEDESSTTARGNIGPSQVCPSRAQAGQGLVRIAPKPALSKRERSPSPNLADPMPVVGCYAFALEPPDGVNIGGSKKPKRGPYAKKTCLRCQTQGQKCSGEFPCEPCLRLWSRRSAQANALAWRACFDSNIHELIFLAKRVDIFPQSFTGISARSPTRTWWAKRIRLLPVVGVPGTFQEIQTYVDSILDVHKSPTPQLLEDGTEYNDCQQTEGGQENENLRLSRSLSSPAALSQPQSLTRAVFILIFHLKETQVVESPDRPAEEGLKEMHSLILEFITCVSRLLIKFKRRLITSSERGLLTKCLWTIMQVAEYSSTSIDFGTDNIDSQAGICLANPSAIDQAYQWDYCPERERHLLMYCEYWLKKLADEQRREEQLIGQSQAMLRYIEPATCYISCLMFCNYQSGSQDICQKDHYIL